MDLCLGWDSFICIKLSLAGGFQNATRCLRLFAVAHILYYIQDVFTAVCQLKGL